MSYKSKMHPRVSNAEIDLFTALSNRGLTANMVTQQPIILKITYPDFMWIEKRKVVYLDGRQVHRKRQEKDEEIDALLELQGWSVLRVPYDPPLTEKRLAEIVGEIQEFLNQSGRKTH